MDMVRSFYVNCLWPNTMRTRLEENIISNHCWPTRFPEPVSMVGICVDTLITETTSQLLVGPFTIRVHLDTASNERAVARVRGSYFSVAVDSAEIPRDVICCGIEIILYLDDADRGGLIVRQVAYFEDGAGLSLRRHGEHLVDDGVVGRDDLDILVEIWVVGTNYPEVQIVRAIVDDME